MHSLSCTFGLYFGICATARNAPCPPVRIRKRAFRFAPWLGHGQPFVHNSVQKDGEDTQVNDGGSF